MDSRGRWQARLPAQVLDDAVAAGYKKGQVTFFFSCNLANKAWREKSAYQGVSFAAQYAKLSTGVVYASLGDMGPINRLTTYDKSGNISGITFSSQESFVRITPNGSMTMLGNTARFDAKTGTVTFYGSTPTGTRIRPQMKEKIENEVK